MIQVYTDNGDTVYYTKEVEYVTKSVPVEDGDPAVLIFVKFVPRNGPSRGLPMTVLVQKISSIVETDQVTDDEQSQISLSIRVRSIREEIEGGQMDEYLAGLATSVEYRQTELTRKSRA